MTVSAHVRVTYRSELGRGIFPESQWLSRDHLLQPNLIFTQTAISHHH